MIQEWKERKLAELSIVDSDVKGERHVIIDGLDHRVGYTVVTPTPNDNSFKLDAYMDGEEVSFYTTNSWTEDDGFSRLEKDDLRNRAAGILVRRALNNGKGDPKELEHYRTITRAETEEMVVTVPVYKHIISVTIPAGTDLALTDLRTIKPLEVEVTISGQHVYATTPIARLCSGYARSESVSHANTPRKAMKNLYYDLNDLLTAYQRIGYENLTEEAKKAHDTLLEYVELDEGTD